MCWVTTRPFSEKCTLYRSRKHEEIWELIMERCFHSSSLTASIQTHTYTLNSFYLHHQISLISFLLSSFPPPSLLSLLLALLPSLSFLPFLFPSFLPPFLPPFLLSFLPWPQTNHQVLALHDIIYLLCIIFTKITPIQKWLMPSVEPGIKRQSVKEAP